MQRKPWMGPVVGRCSYYDLGEAAVMRATSINLLMGMKGGAKHTQHMRVSCKREAYSRAINALCNAPGQPRSRNLLMIG